MSAFDKEEAAATEQTALTEAVVGDDEEDYVQVPIATEAVDLCSASELSGE